MNKKLLWPAAAVLMSSLTTMPYLSSYVSAYASMNGVQIVSNQWKPVVADLNALEHKWDKDGAGFVCRRGGVYFVLVSATYDVEGCSSDDEVRIRGLVNDKWVWNSSAVDKVGSKNRLFLQFHALQELKKGDVVRFEHMRTGDAGLITNSVDMIAPSVVVTIIRID